MGLGLAKRVKNEIEHDRDVVFEEVKDGFIRSMKYFNFNEIRQELKDLNFIVNHMRHDFMVSTEYKLEGLTADIQDHLVKLVNSLTEQSSKGREELEKKLHEITAERAILIESGEGMMDELVRLTTENDSLKSKILNLETLKLKVNVQEHELDKEKRNLNGERERESSKSILVRTETDCNNCKIEDELKELEDLIFSYDFEGVREEKSNFLTQLREKDDIISKLNFELTQMLNTHLYETTSIKNHFSDEIIRIQSDQSQELYKIKEEHSEFIRFLKEDNERNLEQKEREISTLRTEITQKIHEHSEFVAEFNKNHMKVVSDITSKHSKEVDEVKHALLSSQKEVSSLQREVEEVEGEITKLRTDLNTKQSEIDQVKVKMNTITIESSKYVREAKALQEEINDLKIKIKRLTEEKVGLSEELEASRAEIRSVSCVNEVLTETIEEVTNIKEVLREKYEALSGRQDALKNELVERDNELELLRQQHKALQDEHENVRSNNASSSTNLMVANDDCSTIVNSQVNANKLNTALKIEIEKLKETLFRERKLNSLKISDLQDQIDELKVMTVINENDEKENDHPSQIVFNTATDMYTEARSKTYSQSHLTNLDSTITPSTARKDPQQQECLQQ